ncbi:MAG: hypothetical protein HOL15_08840 [Nitrospinaceae bacterium]|nr:hypothetical protein [Nitrospinaceae bacterium]
MKNAMMMKFSTAVLFLSMLLSTAYADEAKTPITATTRIAPNTFTLGDEAIYTISVKHDPDIQPSAPDIKPPQGLELVDKGENPAQTVDQQVIHVFWYKLRVDDVGTLTLPPAPITFQAPDSKMPDKMIQGTILAPEVSLQVQSLLATPGSPKEIRDIKPLAEIPPPWIHYLWMTLAALALIAALYFIWRKWKSRTTNEINAKPSPQLTPEELAYQQLNALKAKDLLNLGRIQEHFFELSEIFRNYLENRYQFPAREWTTEEIIHHFKTFPMLNDTLKLQARAILTHTDRIKFAKADRVEGRDEIQTVIEFIQQAKPVIAETLPSAAS